MNNNLGNNFERDGYTIVADVLTTDLVVILRRTIANLPEDEAVRRRGDAYGVRNLFQLAPEVRELAAHPSIRNLVETVLGPNCFAVRAILFDKVMSANWKVGWHQDKFIAIRERIDTPGFGSWSKKASVWQVIPPVEVMQRLVTLRIHLDDCAADNGPLRVLPGTHRHGWLDGQVGDWRSRVEEVACEAGSGDVLMMRPLLLHASSPAVVPSHRRVIHLEYASDELPGDLEWHERVLPSLPANDADQCECRE